MEGRGRGGRSRFVAEETALRLTKPVCVIPAEAGIQPFGHDEAASRKSKSGPKGVVVKQGKILPAPIAQRQL